MQRQRRGTALALGRAFPDDRLTRPTCPARTRSTTGTTSAVHGVATRTTVAARPGAPGGSGRPRLASSRRWAAHRRPSAPRAHCSLATHLAALSALRQPAVPGA